MTRPGESESELIDRVLRREPGAARRFVNLVTPVVQARVGWILLWANGGRKRGRDPREELRDFTQEVLLALFDRKEKALREWDPARGSLETFVGMRAEKHVLSALRTKKRDPYREEPTDAGAIELAAPADGASDCVYHREFLRKLFERLCAALTPQALLLFQWIFVEGRSTQSICHSLEMKENTLHKWRCRLTERARALAEELDSGPQPPLSSARLLQPEPPEEDAL